MTIILVLDPGTSTGFCLIDVSLDKEGYYVSADIYKYGFIDVDITSNFQGDHCINLMGQIQTLIDTHQVDLIALEDYFFTKKYVNGCTANAAFRTAIHILARQNNIEYEILNVSAWKTYVSGRASPTKEQKKLWGKIPSKKLYIQDALYGYWGFKFPNHSYSSKTNKPIAFRYDIVDVVAQGTYYCAIYLGVDYRKITCSMKVPKDIVFSRPPKKQYLYK